MKKFLYWTPRILSGLLIGFISVFALDMFNEGYTGWDLAYGLTLHLLPTLALIICLIIAWKWEQVGGWLFVAAGLAFAFTTGAELIAILLFMIPLILIGVLFLVHYYKYMKAAKINQPPTTSG
jgi:hypothetical protein